MEQKGSLSFELHLSTSNNPANNSYVIHLSIDLGQVKISKKINNRTTIINETMDRDFVLHEGKNKYWLSIDHANLLLKYGQGEVRDRSTLIRSDVTKAEKDLVRQIEFVHVTFNNSNILANYEWYEYKKSSRFGASNIRATYLRITVGSNTGSTPGIPYVLEIWPPGHYSPVHAHANAYGIIRVLYGEIHVKLYRALDLKKMKTIHQTTIHEDQVT
ncbi:unnamed protein product [Rotaria magnacalcarata]|uniref:Cysteine dioxygenase n=1 Tax=Rotaria magnacalcarata TaxID=392030 RepID=A0A8S3B4T0_9BILA|nr:unnamed protein product [Rotaria magnacalcarata]CAF4795831.1 unnamed protein product [Rotaria magnacalcarata]